jgi:hypothetical protein
MRRHLPPSLFRVVALAVVVGLTLAGCRPDPGSTPAASVAADDRSVVIRPLEAPVRVGATVVEVEVRQDGRPVSTATVRVVGDMTHAGMVPVLDDALHVGDGVYRTSAFAFTMSGDWILTAEVTFPDGARRQGEGAVSVRR